MDGRRAPRIAATDTLRLSAGGMLLLELEHNN